MALIAHFMANFYKIRNAFMKVDLAIIAEMRIKKFYEHIFGKDEPMKLKKGDIIIALILVAAVGFWLYNGYVADKTELDYLVIEVNGSTYKKIPAGELKNPQLVHIEFENNKYIDIEANETGAWIKDVICPDKLCQKTGVIDKVGQSIVCLPNKVNIYFEGDAKSEVDHIAY